MSRKPDSYFDPFPTALRRLMEERNTTQEELAKVLGISRQMISQYCNGKSVPPLSSIAIIAKMYGVSTDFLLGISDIQSTDMDTRGACEYLGLSEDAVKAILRNSHTPLAHTYIGAHHLEPDPEAPELFMENLSLDTVLSNPGFDELIMHLYDLYTQSKNIKLFLSFVENGGRRTERGGKIESSSVEEKAEEAYFMYSQLQISYFEVQEVFLKFINKLCQYTEAKEQISSTVKYYRELVDKEHREAEKELINEIGEEAFYGIDKETDN